MQCQNCGSPVNGNFCPQCGARVDAQAAGNQAAAAFYPTQPTPRHSTLQPALGIAAIVVNVLTMAAGGFLYLKSTKFPDQWSYEAIRFYDYSWAVLFAGGGLALVLALATLFIRDNRRWWAIPGAVLAAALLGVGLFLAA
ncbi:MAG TPA: zinc ribbon domain-containing protein [Symbiobacteriaceae bacterium]|jgi:hypothetical protein|nr:zinc ribbon domain-containing protein [Symbiobacteriaceae bacterium]